MHLHPRRWRYGYAWITLGFFAFSLVGHWLFAWFAYTSEQVAHNQPIQVSDYLIQTLRDTLENWQSEFLQLLWQVGGLAILLHLGSPQSKEGNDRVEEKIDAILRRIDPESGDRTIAELDRRFERQPDDPPEHRWRESRKGAAPGCGPSLGRKRPRGRGRGYAALHNESNPPRRASGRRSARLGLKLQKIEA